MAENNPFKMFGDLDLSKMLGDLKMPGVDLQGVMESQKKNIEALNQANRMALEGVQSLGQRQSQIMRETMEELSGAVKDLSSAQSPQELTSKQTEFAKQAFEKALHDMRELAEMVAHSNSATFEVVNKRISESVDEVKAMLKQMKA